MTDALGLAKERLQRTHQMALKLLDDLSDDQLAWRPAPRAHSIAWTLWHIVRCADRFATDLAGLQGATRYEIWVADGLARRWGLEDAMLGSNGVGTGIDDETAARLRPPQKADLMDYAHRTFAALDASVERLDGETFARAHDSAWLERRTTVGDAVFVSLTHANRHLGELEYVKGLQGLRGTATR